MFRLFSWRWQIAAEPVSKECTSFFSHLGRLLYKAHQHSSQVLGTTAGVTGWPASVTISTGMRCQPCYISAT